MYRVIQQNVRSDIGGIDWDRVTRALDRRFQRRWMSSHKISRQYRKKSEVGLVLNKYQDKLYAFIAAEDRNHEYMRAIISIALVRIAQKGNILAKEEIMKLIRFTIDDWIERYPSLSSWRGYEPLIQKRIKGCIRCYRYSGSFIRYLFRTLEYSGRGVRPLTAYSLDHKLI